MNETRRKPTTGRQSPTLFDKWHGICYMPSRIDEAGHSKALSQEANDSRRQVRTLLLKRNWLENRSLIATFTHVYPLQPNANRIVLATSDWGWSVGWNVRPTTWFNPQSDVDRRRSAYRWLWLHWTRATLNILTGGGQPSYFAVSLAISVQTEPMMRVAAVWSQMT